MNHKCPVCHSSDLIADFIDFNYGYKEFVLSKCVDCGVVFYRTEFTFDFKDNFEHNRSLKVYLEKTSDIEVNVSVVQNLLDAFPGEMQSGIDIGCGVGMIMDYCKQILNREMTGFEPSSHFSMEGRETLQLDIIEDYFSRDKVKSKTDFVVCFQVLQLVNEPASLLSEIRAVLATNGVVLLSTPDNQELQAGIKAADYLPLLSPGVNRILFSEESLSRLLTSAGFTNVRVFRRIGQLFALASDRTLPEMDIFTSNRDNLISYYSQRLQELPGESSYFRGLWYRLYRNRIDHGEYAEALELLRDANWFEIWSESEVGMIRNLDKLYELNSSADAVIYYYTGILFLNFLKKTEYAEKFFNLSFLLCKKIIHIQPDMCAIELDILWLAKLHNILTLTYQGKNQEAKNELLLIVSKNIGLAEELPEPSDEIVGRAQTMLAVL